VTGRHLVLVGLMGSGKTTVGRLLAERLGRHFVDSDEAIESREGRTVREIWLTDGEPAFRELETVALREALAMQAPSVIAAAGGVVLAERNRAALKAADVDVVWLRADPAVLVDRASRGHHRPLLDADAGATLRAMAADRDERYREVATATVDVADLSPTELADAIEGEVFDG
jgi:shikimate kinase